METVCVLISNLQWKLKIDRYHHISSYLYLVIFCLPKIMMKKHTWFRYYFTGQLNGIMVLKNHPVNHVDCRWTVFVKQSILFEWASWKRQRALLNRKICLENKMKMNHSLQTLYFYAIRFQSEKNTFKINTKVKWCLFHSFSIYSFVRNSEYNPKIVRFVVAVIFMLNSNQINVYSENRVMSQSIYVMLLELKRVITHDFCSCDYFWKAYLQNIRFHSNFRFIR